MASSPLIVDARLLPTNLSSSLRTVSDSVARGDNRDGWSGRASQQGDRAASAASDARKGWQLTLVPPGPNDRRGQVESLGRNRLTPDAPYKACSGFTRVTACRIARSPKATFVTRLQPSGLPRRTARQLPAQPTTRWMEPSSTGKPRRLGALNNPGSRGLVRRVWRSQTSPWAEGKMRRRRTTPPDAGPAQPP